MPPDVVRNASAHVGRREVLKAGFGTAGIGLFAGSVPWRLVAAQEKAPRADAAPFGRREIVKGLDGMSRAAQDGNDAFTVGHGAAAVIASAFFCRDNSLDAATQQAVLDLIEARLLPSPIFAPRAEEPADPKLVDGIVQDLDDGIDTLRRSGHNIIFAVLSLAGLREVPEAATPARIRGLRSTVRSFGAGRGPRAAAAAAVPELGDEAVFIRFLFEEYLRALDLYLDGKGHHGFAGHVLTVGHALVELGRMGHAQTAQKGLRAFAQFVQQARAGADLGGQKVRSPSRPLPGPLEPEYWVRQLERPAGSIVSSHLVKYPYSFFALMPDLADEELKQRALQKIFHLTAVS